MEDMLMRDVNAFRERFNYWKSTGELPYEAGLPKYAPGKDDDLIDYIGQLENPTKHGLKDGIWRTPKDSSRWDVHQIGMGLDTRQEHNPIVYNYLKSKGRLNDPWLTEAEERMLRKKTWDQKRPAWERFVKAHDLSRRGELTAAGMLWHGHPYKMMNTKDSLTGKALDKAMKSGDKDLSTVFDTYYGYGSNAKRFASRVIANTNYWKQHPQRSSATKQRVVESVPIAVEMIEAAPKWDYPEIKAPTFGTDKPYYNPATPEYLSRAGASYRDGYSFVPSHNTMLKNAVDMLNANTQLYQPTFNITQ